jgi:hypothetical protein
LLIAWLEGEGERQRCPLLLDERAPRAPSRGWVHVEICALVGALASALFGLWIVTASHQADRVRRMDELRVMTFHEAAAEFGRSAREPLAKAGR